MPRPPRSPKLGVGGPPLPGPPPGVPPGVPHGVPTPQVDTPCGGEGGAWVPLAPPPGVTVSQASYLVRALRMKPMGVPAMPFPNLASNVNSDSHKIKLKYIEFGPETTFRIVFVKVYEMISSGLSRPIDCSQPDVYPQDDNPMCPPGTLTWGLGGGCSTSHLRRLMDRRL